MKTKEEIEAKIKELRADEQKFSTLLSDIFNDKTASKRVQQHTWRVRREINILEWVLNQDLPF